MGQWCVFFFISWHGLKIEKQMFRSRILPTLKKLFNFNFKFNLLSQIISASNAQTRIFPRLLYSPLHYSG